MIQNSTNGGFTPQLPYGDGTRSDPQVNRFWLYRLPNSMSQSTKRPEHAVGATCRPSSQRRYCLTPPMVRRPAISSPDPSGSEGQEPRTRRARLGELYIQPETLETLEVRKFLSRDTLAPDSEPPGPNR